ncbi:MAG: HAD-IA family hydrolase [Verrucomicrobiales bacterium]|nr:HAD-IA family hydrolase [Verrucomicrobiales bacterium]
MPEALIFDFDGLILDTEVPVYEAWRQNYEAHDQTLPLETYVNCVGSDFNRFDPKAHLETLTNAAIDWSHWDPRREQIARDQTLGLTPFPGIIDLLEEASASQVPCIVASSSPRSWVEGHLDRLGLQHYFEATRCLDDVAAPKPSPDLFIAAAEALSIHPDKAIVLEDSLNGLNAAKAAGIDCVIVPNRITASLDFTGAAAVLPTLEGVSIRQLASIKTGTG